MSDINYLLILPAAILSTSCPGPSTMSILSTSMAYGRKFGFLNAFGVWTGAFIWSLSAAAGFSTLLASTPWLMNFIRVAGAAYLLFLSFKSAKAALTPNENLIIKTPKQRSGFKTYTKGLFIQLANPKAPLFFGSLYSVAVPITVTPHELLLLIVLLACNGFIILSTYAFLFSASKARDTFQRLRRYFETSFSLFFGFLGFKLILQ